MYRSPRSARFLKCTSHDLPSPRSLRPTRAVLASGANERSAAHLGREGLPGGFPGSPRVSWTELRITHGMLPPDRQAAPVRPASSYNLVAHRQNSAQMKTPLMLTKRVIPATASGAVYKTGKTTPTIGRARPPNLSSSDRSASTLKRAPTTPYTTFSITSEETSWTGGRG